MEFWLFDFSIAKKIVKYSKPNYYIDSHKNQTN